MGFTRFPADHRLPPMSDIPLRAPDPSEPSPPDQGDTVTAPLQARSPHVPPLSWLALFRPAHRPKPARSSKVASTSGVSRPRVRCRTTALPRWTARCSLGLLSDSRPSPVVLVGRVSSGRSRDTRCSGARSEERDPPDGAPTEVDPPGRQDRETRAFRHRSCHRSGHHRDAGPRIPACGRVHMPPRSKLRAGALAFQTAPLPLQSVTIRDALLVSVGASACADRRTEALRRRGCPRLVAQAFTSLSRPRECRTEVLPLLRLAPVRLPAGPEGSSRSRLARQRPR